MRRLSLRLRITAAISIVCISLVASLGSAFYVASERMELALVEQLVGEELDFLIKRYESDPSYTPISSSNVWYYILNVSAEPNESPPFLRGLSDGHHEIDIGNNMGERDIMIRRVGDLRFVVVYNIGPYEQREVEFKQLVVIALVTVMILAIVMGYLLSGFLTKQLALLAIRVSNLTPGEKYESLQHQEQDREAAMLASAFDQYHELFLGMIQREQEFTSNVSHELRTPLTAIRTSCELLTADPSLSERAQQRIRNILHSTNNMAEHIHALLLLARQQEIGLQEEFALRECLDDVLAPLWGEMTRKGIIFSDSIPPETVINTNRQSLQIVLGNIVRNAINYTDSGFIKVNLVEGAIEVVDSGPGISIEQQALIFARNYRGNSKTAGLGLGLDIVRRLCERMGWKVDVRSVEGEGAVFRIDILQAI